MSEQAGEVTGSPFPQGRVLDAVWKAYGLGANGAAAGEPAETAPRPDPAGDHNGGEVTMSEQVTEQATEQVDPYTALEQEAGGFLEAAGDDLNAQASALIRRFRTVIKRHGEAIERTRAETRTQVMAELRQAREHEAAYRRLNVPETARVLFQGVDPGNEQAMAQRAEELRLAGVTWSGQPVPPPPPPPDPNLASMLAMQAAEAGGDVSGNGSLEHRIQKMAADPGAYSDEQVRAVIGELNQQVRASVTPSSGALG